MSDFFTQKLIVEDWNPVPRAVLFASLCKDKKVLHVGCVDAPIFEPSSSLHLALEKVAGELHGYDLAPYDELAKHTKSELLKSFPTGQKYDVVLVPEVLEHVSNAGQFLERLDTIDFEHMVITVPDAYQCAKRGHWFYEGNDLVEVVHPDHVAWYSAYTLKALIERATTWKVQKLFYINGISCGALCIK